MLRANYNASKFGFSGQAGSIVCAELGRGGRRFVTSYETAKSGRFASSIQIRMFPTALATSGRAASGEGEKELKRRSAHLR